MSIIYRIDKELAVTFVLWDGLVTADEFLSHVQRLITDAAWLPQKYSHLSDLQTASLAAAIDETVLAKAADLFGKHPKLANLKGAIIANQEFRKATVFERLISRYEPSVIVFNDLETACTWLGIDVNRVTQTLQSLRSQSR